MLKALVQLILEWSRGAFLSMPASRLPGSLFEAERHLRTLEDRLVDSLLSVESYYDTPQDVYVVVGIYLARLSNVVGFRDLSMPQTLLPLITLAHKFLYDNAHPVEAVAFSACIPQSQLAAAEGECVRLMGWNLFVTTEEFNTFKVHLERAWAQRYVAPVHPTALHPQHQPQHRNGPGFARQFHAPTPTPPPPAPRCAELRHGPVAQGLGCADMVDSFLNADVAELVPAPSASSSSSSTSWGVAWPAAPPLYDPMEAGAAPGAPCFCHNYNCNPHGQQHGQQPPALAMGGPLRPPIHPPAPPAATSSAVLAFGARGGAPPSRPPQQQQPRTPPPACESAPNPNEWMTFIDSSSVDFNTWPSAVFTHSTSAF